MFNLINIGERAGSGVPNIFNTWADQGWPEPIIEEEFDPDRTILVLTIKKKRRTKTSSKKQAIKTSDKTSNKTSNKTFQHMNKIKKISVQKRAFKNKRYRFLYKIKLSTNQSYIKRNA